MFNHVEHLTTNIHTNTCAHIKRNYSYRLKSNQNIIRNENKNYSQGRICLLNGQIHDMYQSHHRTEL